MSVEKINTRFTESQFNNFSGVMASSQEFQNTKLKFSFLMTVLGFWQ